MKRALTLCLFLSLSSLSGECATTFFPPLQPLAPTGQTAPLQDYNNSLSSLPEAYSDAAGVNYQEINKVEQSLFGRSFNGQNISARLSRIEKTMFSRTYQGTNELQRIDNIISNFNQLNKYPNISKNSLSKIENQILNQSFPQSSVERRIERLEQQMFGAVQSGNYNSRYEAIKMVAKNYNKNMAANNDPYAVNMQQGGFKGLKSNLGNMFFGGSMGGLGGSMTGFTPPIGPYYGNYNKGYNPYNAYSNPYSACQPGSGSGIYRGVRNNNGLNGYSYNDSYTDYGSGAGVTILD